jgi:hypothetical protein
MVLAVGWLRGIGFVTGLMLLLFGLCAFGFHRWRRERGLWMLAAVGLVVYVPFYTVLQYDALKQHFNGPPAAGASLAATVDALIAAAIVWRMVRFLLTVLWYNRMLSRLGVVVVRLPACGGPAGGPGHRPGP